MESKDINWRYPSQRSISYPACYDFLLNDGVLITEKGTFRVDNSSGLAYTFRFICESQYPVLSSMNSVLSRLGLHQCPIFMDSWKTYLTDDPTPNPSQKYSYSVYPFIYMLCTSLVITLFFTSILFTKHYITAFKPGFLMKASCLVASGQLIAVNIFSLINLSRQAQQGKSSANSMIQPLIFSTGFSVVYLVAFSLLLLSQVDIIKRLYPRRKERRATLILGTVLVIITECLWAVSTFVSDNETFPSYLITVEAIDSADTDRKYDSAIAILPVFVNLLEISLSVIYSSLIYVYCFSKRQFAFHSRMLPLTVIMVISLNSPIAFFIADISNMWINELSDLFNLVCYVITNVTTWEWLNRLEQVEKTHQRDNVLGRPFFADNYADTDDESINNEATQEELDAAAESVPVGAASHFSFNLKPENYSKVKRSFLRYRDAIELRLGKNIRHLRPIPLRGLRYLLSGRQKEPSVHEQETATAGNGGNVYIYRPKEVVIENGGSDVSIMSDNISRGTDSDSISEVDVDAYREISMIDLRDSHAANHTSLGLRWMASKKFLKHQRNVVEHGLKTIGDGSLDLGDEEPAEIRNLNLDGDVHFEYESEIE
ncbi:DEKNAAC102513 [Brettanomyces naardenensis]|uniref:pH-response regulator protein palH/RIM21 n=1 Tax=Brettanomyces naardenensis TaxID=13370 RepID=A0A448YL00_BRENA|nr:DEKNAAC102513 [Brettanomyces naardenensis]